MKNGLHTVTIKVVSMENEEYKMSGNIVLPSEENDVLWEMKRVKHFLSSLEEYDFSIVDILGEIGKETLMREVLFFSFGIEYNENFFLFDKETARWEEKGALESSKLQDKYAQIEWYFSGQVDGVKRRTGWCRRIGGILQKQFYVYFYVAAGDNKIDPLFLKCAEDVYCDWLSGQLSIVLNATEDAVGISHLDRGRVIKALGRGISEKFRTDMWNIFGVDVDTITEISSIYYEGASCCSHLVFLLTDIGDGELPNGLTLDVPVEVETKNIKKIRKLLQTGQSGQCLLVCRNAKNVWVVKGLYEETGLTARGISFQIMGHMVWRMMVGEKLAVCYICGKYRIENEQFEVRELKRRYEEVFGKTFDENCREIFEQAMEQKHGTILIIIMKDAAGDNNVEAEVERLINDSAGTKIEARKVPEHFIKSMTEIDGALILDDEGICYGFGVILDSDSKVKVRGNPERGARFNSTKKYIGMCREKGMKVIGVVVSEDRTIDIFTTNDELNEVNQNGRK